MEQNQTWAHFDDEWFEQYVRGTLPEDKLEIFEERLLVDESVQRRLDETETYMKAMKGALRRAQTELAGDDASFFARLKQWVAQPMPLMAGMVGAAAAVLIVVSVLHRSPDALRPATTVELHAMRGAAEEAVAPAGHVRFVLDTRGLAAAPAYSAQVVTDQGQEMWKGPIQLSGDSVAVDVPKMLKPGHYLVRIDNGAEQLREYAVALR